MRIAGLRVLTAVVAVLLALPNWVLPVFAQPAPADIPLAAPVEVAPEKAKYKPTRKIEGESQTKPAKRSKPEKSKQPVETTTKPPLPAKPVEVAKPAETIRLVPEQKSKELPPSIPQPTRDYKVPDDPDVALAQTLTQSFREDFGDVLRMAQKQLLLTCPKKSDRKNAVAVLDLDETLMDNRAYFAVHKKFNQKDWDVWVTHEEAPAIPEARAFVYWLQEAGFKVYFVSGRKESQREATAKNLARMGITYDGMYLKPDDYNKASAGDFKINARKQIADKGLRIVLVLGDQKSDLVGAEDVGFKLPNPIYFIP